EWFAIHIVMSHKVIDALNQFGYRAERTAANRAPRDQCKEPLDQVQPRAVSRHEMQMPAWPGGQPGLDLGMFVGSVVIDDQVDVEIAGNLSFDPAQET